MGEATPFLVEIRLASPVSLNHPWFHLDGILTHLARNRVLGRDQFNQPTKLIRSMSARELGPYANLLVRTPVPHGSISFFGPVEKLSSINFFKRFEERGFPARRKIAMGFGHYRAWMMRTVYCPVEWARFYGCGQVDLVRDLLGDLTHLGNKSRMGWGAIASISVEERDLDESVVADGYAMRPIPARLCRRYAEALPMAWRPPYWDPAGVELCVPPGSEVELMSSREMRNTGVLSHG